MKTMFASIVFSVTAAAVCAAANSPVPSTVPAGSQTSSMVSSPELMKGKPGSPRPCRPTDKACPAD